MKNRQLTMIALLIALSVIGSYITIFMSVALDSLPGFFGAMLLGALPGGIVGAVGHFMTALVHGFPLGLPTHLLVMALMFAACYFLGMFYKKNKFLGLFIALMINWPLSLILSSLMAYAMGVIPTAFGLVEFLFIPLFLGTIMNLIPAAIIYEAIGKRIHALS